MVKEEVIKAIEELRIATMNYRKYKEYVDSFVKEPRCKKGVLEFIDTLMTYGDAQDEFPAVYGKVRRELSLQLVLSKSTRNNQFLLDGLRKLTFESHAANRLVELRYEVIKLTCDYILYIQSELDKSPLTDARERQLYLRRALARLKTVTSTFLVAPIAKDQWSDVKPSEWIDYLNGSMPELMEAFLKYAKEKSPWSIDFNANGLDLVETFVLDSIESFLDYLDTFVKF